MKKTLKIISIVVLALVVLVVSIPFIFKGKLLEIAQNEINKNINATVKFDNFDVSIFKSFPSLTVTLDEFSVVGVDKFQGDTLAYLKQMYVDLDIMSVINGGQIKIQSIVLDSPVIRGLVLADSSANWDIAKDTGSETDTTTDTAATKFQLGLKRFEIINADIVYDDKPGKTYAELKGFNFLLKGDFTQDFTSLDINMAIKELTAKSNGIAYLKKADVEFIAGIEADLVKSKYVFKDNNLRINNLELGFEGSVEMPDDENINMDVKFGAKKTSFKNILSLVPAIYLTDFASVKTDGKLTLNGNAKGTFNSLKELYPAFDLKLIVEKAMFKYPDLPGSCTDIDINLAINNPDGLLDHTVIDMSKFHVSFSGNPFDMTLMVRTPISDPLIKCGLIGTIDLGKLKEIVPLDGMDLSGIINSDVQLEGNLSTIEQEKYEDFKALGNIRISALNYKDTSFPQGITINTSHIEFSPKFVTLHEFDSKVGKSDFKLTGKLENFIPYIFADGTVRGELNLVSSLIDVNELMGTDTTTAAEDTAQATGDPVIVPKNIEFLMTTAISSILYDKMNITAVAGKISVKDGKASLDNLNMKMLGGSMGLNGYYSTENVSKPVMDFGMTIKDFDIQSTYNQVSSVKEMLPYAEKAKGQYSMSLSINTLVDNSMSPILNTLDGKGGMETKQIVAEGGKLANEIADKLHDDKYRQYEFKNMKANFKIEDGNIILDPFTTQFNGNTATIEGVSNLDQTIKYKIATEIPRANLGGAANSVIEGLNALAKDNGVNASVGDIIVVDMLFTGVASDPKVGFKLGTKSSDGSSNNASLDKAKAELMKKKAELEAKARAEAEAAKAQAQAAVNDAKNKAEAQAKAAADKAKADAEAKANAAKKKIEEDAKNKAKNYSEDAKSKLKW